MPLLLKNFTMADRLELQESYSDRCQLYRYRLPVEVVEGLQYEGSKYSPEFQIAGVPWRLHLQHRTDKDTDEVYLAIHLQCLGSTGAYGHFRLTVCNRDPQAAKGKTFHCQFKKSGSAWGLHHFIPLSKLLSHEHGFIDEVQDGRRISRYVVIDVVINVLEAGADGSFALGSLPQGSRSFGAPIPPQHAYGGSAYHDPHRSSLPQTQSRSPAPFHQQQTPSMPSQQQGLMVVQDPANPNHIKAPLVFPFEHLEGLCDMWFDVNGVRIKAHRCVIAARMAVLIPDEMLPLQEGTTISIADSVDVFTAFLRYVYTEDYPEQGVLRPEALLDLYLLAARCEFYDLCGVCLKYVRPLLNANNILPIVLTKYSTGDEVLNALYLRVLLDNYDVLIQDRTFEEIPGHLFRRLSLILREKERLPAVTIAQTRNTLGRQLAALAESGEYADYEIKLGEDAYIPAHRYILASRSVVYSHAFSPKGGASREPIFDGPDNTFSFRAWQKFLVSLYRRTLGDLMKDLSAEDIALLFKMHVQLTLDGQLKREAELAVTPDNALRVLIYAVKHNVSELKDRAMVYVASNFNLLVRNDPQAWDLIGELPQPAVCSLFRTVTEAH